MKKWIGALCATLLLSGCGTPEVFETMSDVYVQEQLPAAARASITLPQDAAVEVLEDGSGGCIYLCDGYSITIQTLQAGNLDSTLRAVTGYGADRLQLLERTDGMATRYACVWAAAGEGGDQVGRAVILDDGNYHYVLTVMAEAEQAAQLRQTWQTITDSFGLEAVPQ